MSRLDPTTVKPHHPPLPPRRVLVVCLQRLGDVLTVTPLLRSLRRAWPDSAIDVLVPGAAAAILEGNPDVHRVLVEPARDERWRFLRRLWRAYDLALGTQPNDRPFVYALVAARRRVMVVPPPDWPGAGRKRWLSHGWCEVSLSDRHVVDQYLRLADVLGVPATIDLVPPSTRDTPVLDALLGTGWRGTRLAVVHPSPMFRYKAWTLDGWVASVSRLAGRHGLRVVVTGGPAAGDAALATAIVDAVEPALRTRVVPAAGRLRFAELAELLRASCIYLGPDTSVTHLAAACGTPAIALYGPSHPVAWGPWPGSRAGAGRASPWVMKAASQQAGPVRLLQGEGDCVPCLKEGCERRLDSPSRCLDELPPSRVIQALDDVLSGA